MLQVIYQRWSGCVCLSTRLGHEPKEYFFSVILQQILYIINRQSNFMNPSSSMWPTSTLSSPSLFYFPFCSNLFPNCNVVWRNPKVIYADLLSHPFLTLYIHTRSLFITFLYMRYFFVCSQTAFLILSIGVEYKTLKVCDFPEHGRKIKCEYKIKKTKNLKKIFKSII